MANHELPSESGKNEAAEITQQPVQIHALEFTTTTLTAVKELAQVTGQEGGLSKVVQDSLRTYEWIIHQQTLGRTIIALEGPDMAVLESDEKLSGEREILVPFVLPDQIENARAYFNKPQFGTPEKPTP